MGDDGFFWVYVHGFHEPSWFVRADGEAGEVWGAYFVVNFFEVRSVTGVAGEEYFFILDNNDEAAPEGFIAVEEGARGEVLCGGEDYLGVLVGMGLPPIEFDDVCDVV